MKAKPKGWWPIELPVPYHIGEEVQTIKVLEETPNPDHQGFIGFIRPDLLRRKP